MSLRQRKETKALAVALVLAAVAMMVPPVTHAAITAEGFVQNWMILGPYRPDSPGADPGYAVIRGDFLYQSSPAVITERNIVPVLSFAMNTNYAVAASASFYDSQPTNGYPGPTIFPYTAAANTIQYESDVYGTGDDTLNDHMNHAFVYADNKTGAIWSGFIGCASDDSIQVLLNGSEVWANNAARWHDGGTQVQDAAPVVLAPGLNLFVVKVFDGGGGSGFRFRLQTSAFTGTGSAAEAVPESAVEFKNTNQTFTYPILNVASATRRIPGVGLYPMGTSNTVVVNVGTISGNPTATVAETAPAGFTITGTPIVSQGSAVVAAQTINWTVGAVTGPAQLTYFVAPPAAAGTVTFTGTIASEATLPTAGDADLIPRVPLGTFDWHGNIGGAGDPSTAGNQSLANPIYTITASGSDVWGSTDHGGFFLKRLVGDGYIESNAVWNPAGGDGTWCKMGVMARANVSAGSAHTWIGWRNPAETNETCVQWRDTQNGGSGAAGEFDLGNPVRYRVVRRGTTIDSYYQNPATLAWVLQNTHDTPGLDYHDILLGLFVTSHQNGTDATADFSNVVAGPLAIRSATRDIQASTFTVGSVVHVRINIDRATAAAVTVREVVPAGWTISNATGGTINGTTATWTAFTGTSVELDATAGASADVRFPAVFRGSVTDSLSIVTAVGGDLSITPGGPVLFQAGVYPDASYGGVSDTYITMYGTSGNTIPKGGPPPYGDRNQGAYTELEEGDWRGYNRPMEDPAGYPAWAVPGYDDNKLILIRFELYPTLRSRDTVQEAWLRLHYEFERRTGSASTATVAHYSYAHMLAKGFGEGTGGGSDGPAALPGEANFISARLGVQNWETSGARGLSDIVAPSIFQARSQIQYGKVDNVNVDYNVTNAVIQWVQNGPNQNFGLKISQDDKQTPPYWSVRGYEYGAYNFASSQNDNVSIRPVLSVRFTQGVVPLAVRNWSIYR
jgi:hypothetical protein